MRIRPLVVGQPAEFQREIRRRFDELLEAHRTQDGFDVPVAVKIASGARA